MIKVCLLITLISLSGLIKANSLGAIAVADVKLGNSTAKLVYKEQGVRDTLTKELHSLNKFKVIDWSRLSAVLFRRNLEWSDVVNSEKERAAIKDVLLNDYFLTGSVSHYSERMEYDSGVFSDSKTQIATLQLDLFIKDAISNEIVVSARGHVEKKKEVKQSLGFGSSAGTSFSLAQDALNSAAKIAIADLVTQLEKKKKKGK